MFNGTIIAKLEILDETLIELRSLGHVTTSQLETDWRTRRAIERNLQIIVEIVIDVCQRIITITNQTPATTSLEAIQRCIQMGVLSPSDAYKKMVQFRNFIVHRYENIDATILVDVLNRRLTDFEQFRHEVLAYVQSHNHTT